MNRLKRRQGKRTRKVRRPAAQNTNSNPYFRPLLLVLIVLFLFVHVIKPTKTQSDQPQHSWLPQTAMRWKNQCKTIAPKYGIDYKLCLALITVESCGRPDAISSANALGLTQVVPQPTGKCKSGRDFFKPNQNIDGGMCYLGYLKKLKHSDMKAAIVAYNVGPNANQETIQSFFPQLYLKWVYGIWQDFDKPSSLIYQDFTKYAFSKTRGGLCLRALGSSGPEDYGLK